MLRFSVLKKALKLKRGCGIPPDQGACFGVTNPEKLRPSARFKEPPYTCEDAKKDIDFFFSGEGTTTPEQEEALKRVLYRHMVLASLPKNHIIACQKCWDYYQGMKRTHCGG